MIDNLIKDIFFHIYNNFSAMAVLEKQPKFIKGNWRRPFTKFCHLSNNLDFLINVWGESS